MLPVHCIGYIKDTGTPKGFGLFASRAIAADEIVEICPVIQIKPGLPPKEPVKIPYELMTLVLKINGASLD